MCLKQKTSKVRIIAVIITGIMVFALSACQTGVQDTTTAGILDETTRDVSLLTQEIGSTIGNDLTSNTDGNSTTKSSVFTTGPIAATKPTATKEPTISSNELEGVAAERLEFTKVMLNLYDGSVNDHVAFSKIKNFVTRQQIINYGKTGEGLSVVKYDNGTPAVALINCNDNITNIFNSMISQMKSYDSNYLKKLTSNGMVAFMVNRYEPNWGNTFTFNRNGLTVWNLASEEVNTVTPGKLKRTVETEAFGIKMYSLGGDYANYIGFMKELLSSDCWWNLWKKTGDQYCYDMSQSSYMISKITYGPAYAPVTLQDEKIQNLLKNIRDKNLATSFGGSWSEISVNIVDRPDWE